MAVLLCCGLTLTVPVVDDWLAIHVVSSPISGRGVLERLLFQAQEYREPRVDVVQAAQGNLGLWQSCWARITRCLIMRAVSTTE